jgi:hypothetical protein
MISRSGCYLPTGRRKALAIYNLNFLEIPGPWPGSLNNATNTRIIVCMPPPLATQPPIACPVKTKTMKSNLPGRDEPVLMNLPFVIKL